MSDVAGKRDPPPVIRTPLDGRVCGCVRTAFGGLLHVGYPVCCMRNRLDDSWRSSRGVGMGQW